MGTWWRAIAICGCAVLLATSSGWAEASRPSWRDVLTPAAGSPQSIGDYSAGCIRGAKALPLFGEGYQVAHPERRRNFGHPDLVGFLTELGHKTHAAGLMRLMLGDLGQPRGGPTPGGHSSHQTGLDVDVWYWSPVAAQAAPFPPSELSALKARSVLDGKTQSLATRFATRVAALLRLTASDPRVTRIFVHPGIKRSLCADTHDERAWLAKLRPWFGHDDHFHVRLACPLGSPDCKSQPPIQPGDGCEQIDWWFNPGAQTEREEERGRYRTKVVRPLRMPDRCNELLE